MIELLAMRVGLRNGIFTIYRIPLRRDFPSSLLRHLSSSSINKERSFTVSYLVSQFGISSDRASALSKYVKFQTPEKPNSVLRFLREQHFSESQISNVVKGCPRVLMAQPTQTLLPKLQFLRSLDLSDPDVAEFVSSSPQILMASLKNQLVPCFEFFRDHYKSREEAVAAIKRRPRALTASIHRQAPPLLQTLRDAGTPERAITQFVRQYWRMRWIPGIAGKFQRVVDEVVAMGIDPTKWIFVDAVALLSNVTISTWKQKLAVYAKWGWSQEQALEAFRKWPNCFSVSEKKIDGLMDLFVNKLGWDSSFVAKYPIVFTYSLQKRLLPRAFVLLFLDSEGLLPHDRASPRWSVFLISEKTFLEKYVLPYPESSALLTLYLEKKKSGLPSNHEGRTTQKKKIKIKEGSYT
ncbi:unnamed protein product [Linum trigynum]|uniref:Uncharacterized protein n=1 Tax=Linum trigynum TaxID=586398 RepID=A0AAV2GSH0_9ROSI